MTRRADERERQAHEGDGECDTCPTKTASAASDDRRARLRQAILHEVAENGYVRAKIKEIAAHAGVSTKTFYGLYTDKEECLLGALRETSEAIQREVAHAIAGAQPEAAATAVLGALVEYATRHRDAFYALTYEGLCAGTHALAERDSLFAQIHREVEAAVDAAPISARAPDIPAMILISGTIRTLGLTIRRGEPRSELRHSLSRWADAYSVPRALHRWRSFTPEAALMSPEEPVTWAPVEQLQRRGYTAAAGAAITRAQRDRILRATAQSTHLKGYATMTVTDIIATGHLSRDVFYAHFRGKREAFTALVMQTYEHAIGRCARAFLMSAGPWPERVWDTCHAMAHFLASDPSVAYASLAEGYVLGPDVLHTDDLMLSYVVFLADGYRHRPDAAQTPRLVGEAIGGATLETIIQMIRRGRSQELPGLLPLITYMVLSPFTGTATACEVIDRKLVEHKAKRSTAKGEGSGRYQPPRARRRSHASAVLRDRQPGLRRAE